MIICSCRVISDRDYECKNELQQRLEEDDIVCGCCITELEDRPLAPEKGNDNKRRNE